MKKKNKRTLEFEKKYFLCSRSCFIVEVIGNRNYVEKKSPVLPGIKTGLSLTDGRSLLGCTATLNKAGRISVD